MDDIGDFLMNDGEYWQAADFILTDILTTMVNIMEMPVGITVFIKGLILSGSLVSESQYLNSLSQVFRGVARMSLESDGTEPSEEDLEKMFDFTKLAENDYSAIFDDDDEEGDDAGHIPGEDADFDAFYEAERRGIRPTRFMHMKDVMVLYPGASIGFRHSILPIVRLRVSSVDGWILGQALDPDSIADEDAPRPMVH